jgi:hypothetical protein
MYLVTWIEGEEVQYRFLSSEEFLSELDDKDKNPIVVEFDA